MEDHHHPLGHGSEAPPPKDAVDKGCGMFGFLKKKYHEEKPTEDMVTPDAEKTLEVKNDKDKPTLMEKLHRSSSSLSSSGNEEGGGEDGEEQEKKKEENCDRNEHLCIPGEKCDASATNPEEQKGFMEQMKELLPLQHKKAEEGAAATGGHSSDEEGKDKKGFLEKIKENLPGSHKIEGKEKIIHLGKND